MQEVYGRLHYEQILFLYQKLFFVSISYYYISFTEHVPSIVPNTRYLNSALTYMIKHFSKDTMQALTVKQLQELI